VLASGCFDPLHPGHVAYLEAARAFGDQLVVGVTADRWVQARKGIHRPYFPANQRCHMLESLRVVDEVRLVEADDMVHLINGLRPVIYAKGGDYRTGDPTGRLEQERHAVEAGGGRLVFVDTWPRYSSTVMMDVMRQALEKTLRAE